MPINPAVFSQTELAEVLGHYGIGVVQDSKPLSAGNRASPKLIVVTDRGRYLLKRRPQGKDDVYRVAFAHAVQIHLAIAEFPVVPLVTTSDGKGTIVQCNGYVYELFEFLNGRRYDGSNQEIMESSRKLGEFHQIVKTFEAQWDPLRGSFHDSASVRRHLKMLASNRMAVEQPDMQRVGEDLMRLYNDASIRVNECGFDSWPVQVVHGDWHPGNLMFAKGEVLAVLDFDSVKISTPMTDLANGMLQFSLVGSRPNPVDWPGYLDQVKLKQFVQGYRETNEIPDDYLHAMLDLMIETIIAEAVVPVAATGTFAGLKGVDFLQMIQRKASWIERHRNELYEDIK